MEVKTAQQPTLYNITLEGLTEEQYGRAVEFAKTLNGTLPKKQGRSKRVARHAGKRSSKTVYRKPAPLQPHPQVRAKRNGNAMKHEIICPVGNEVIGTQGMTQHIGKHGRDAGWTQDQIDLAVVNAREGMKK